MTYDDIVKRSLALVAEGSLAYPGQFSLKSAAEYFSKCNDLWKEIEASAKALPGSPCDNCTHKDICRFRGMACPYQKALV